MLTCAHKMPKNTIEYNRIKCYMRHTTVAIESIYIKVWVAIPYQLGTTHNRREYSHKKWEYHIRRELDQKYAHIRSENQV